MKSRDVLALIWTVVGVVCAFTNSNPIYICSALIIAAIWADKN